MKCKNKVVVACTPLTGKLIVGELNKKGDTFIGETYDVEGSVIGAVTEYMIKNNVSYEFTYKGRKVKLQVVDR